MGKHVHQVVLGRSQPLVDELDRRFCSDIWNISTWFSLTHFLIQWSTTVVGEYFSCALLFRVDYHKVISLTEFILLGVLLSIIWAVFRCNQNLNVSVDFSLEIFHLLLWRVTIWQCSWCLSFHCYLLSISEVWGSFRFEQFERKFVPLGGSRLFWGVASTLFWFSCSRQWSFQFGWSYCIDFSPVSGLVFFLWLQDW